MQARVLKMSLPWVRLPAFQSVMASAVLIPFLVAVVAGLFQLAADGFSLFACVFLVAGIGVQAFPTKAYLKAKSYHANRREEAFRSKLKQLCFLIALGFVILWISFSPRLRKLLEDSATAKLISAAQNPALLIDAPSAPIWLVVAVLLDFFGKAVVSKLFFCDVLLRVVLHTELQGVTPQQEIMRDAAASQGAARPGQRSQRGPVGFH